MNQKSQKNQTNKCRCVQSWPTFFIYVNTLWKNMENKCKKKIKFNSKYLTAFDSTDRCMKKKMVNFSIIALVTDNWNINFCVQVELRVIWCEDLRVVCDIMSHSNKRYYFEPQQSNNWNQWTTLLTY